MFLLQGRIRDYSAADDTASVELEHLGIIDSWLTQLHIDASVNRAYLVHNAQVTIQTADPHRLCEAIVVGIGDSPGTPVQSGPAGSVRVVAGRSWIATDGAGNGSTNYVFNPPFGGIPTFAVTADDKRPITISSLTTTGSTVSLAGSTPNTYVYFSFQASGH